MSNMCQNTVHVSEEPQIVWLFLDLIKGAVAEHENKRENNLYPVRDGESQPYGFFISDYSKFPKGFKMKEEDPIFDLHFDSENPNVFHYETKYSPNDNFMSALAQNMQVESVHFYEELSDGTYGKTITSLTNKATFNIAEFINNDTFHYDLENDVYRFKGEPIIEDCKYEVFDLMLENLEKNGVDFVYDGVEAFVEKNNNLSR